MNPLRRLFSWKVRGVRWVEIIGVVLVAAMVFSVYLTKTAAAREGARIDQLEREIAENAQRVRLLKAEAAQLEQPGRLEALSRAAGLGPVDVRRQADGRPLETLKPTGDQPHAVVLAAPTPPTPAETEVEAPPSATPADTKAEAPQ